jgi:galactonate dehydratase
MSTAQLARRAKLQSIMAWQAAAPGAVEPLAIKDLRIYPLREPDSGRAYAMVRVESRGGAVGWGECGAAVPGVELAAAKQALGGFSAHSYEVAWRRLEAAPTLRPAIDMALLDIAAQQSKAPVYQMLGGPTRTKCRAYAPLEGPAALERNQKAGHKAFGVPAPPNEWRNAGKPYVDKATALMRMVRQAAGPGHDFVLDGGGRLTPGDAQSVADALERFHLLCFDEPVASTNLGAVKKISGENVTPIGLGRALTTAGGFEDLLREDCVDLLRPSLSRLGVSQIKRIAAIGEVYYVAVAPYHDGGPLATLAALHLAAAIPNFFIQQIPSPSSERDRAMRKALLSEDVERVNAGYAALPNTAGWGARVNEAAVERYSKEAGA